jgi:hypothetical protein
MTFVSDNRCNGACQLAAALALLDESRSLSTDRVLALLDVNRPLASNRLLTAERLRALTSNRCSTTALRRTVLRRSLWITAFFCHAPKATRRSRRQSL